MTSAAAAAESSRRRRRRRSTITKAHTQSKMKNRDSMTMYFDDVSRYGLRMWKMLLAGRQQQQHRDNNNSRSNSANSHISDNDSSKRIRTSSSTTTSSGASNSTTSSSIATMTMSSTPTVSAPTTITKTSSSPDLWHAISVAPTFPLSTDNKNKPKTTTTTTRTPPLPVSKEVSSSVTTSAAGLAKTTTSSSSSTGGNNMKNKVPNTKMNAMQRMMMGYDAMSASRFTSTEIIAHTEFWALKSGVVGDFFGDELFHESLGTTVCSSNTPLGCIAQFWKEIAIKSTSTPSSDETEEDDSSADDTTRWTVASVPREKVRFIVFPTCSVLYDYDTLFTIVAALEFSKEHCELLGEEFTLTMFHPKYKQSLKMCTPERCSPFPTIGLHYNSPEIRRRQQHVGRTPDIHDEHANRGGQNDDEKEDETKNNKGSKLGGNQATSPSLKSSGRPQWKDKNKPNYVNIDDLINSDDDDEEDDDGEVEDIDVIVRYLADGNIYNLDKKRNDLEALFNSAAAVKDVPDFGTTQQSPPQQQHQPSLSSSSSLVGGPQQQEQPASVKEDDVVSHDEVREVSMSWMMEKKNRRRSFVNYFVPHDVNRWIISDEDVGENVYADLWKAISDLYDIGVQTQKQYDMDTGKTLTTEDADSSDSVWLSSQDNVHPTITTTATTAPTTSQISTEGNDDQGQQQQPLAQLEWIKGAFRRFPSSTEVAEGEDSIDDFYDNHSVEEQDVVDPAQQQQQTTSSTQLSSSSVIADGGLGAAAATTAGSAAATAGVECSMFVATKFCRYNASSFRSFAMTVSVVLKQLTDDRMFLEVYHPEYVAGSIGTTTTTTTSTNMMKANNNKSNNNNNNSNAGSNSRTSSPSNSALRRSPYPMIQIFYKVQKKLN